MNGWQQCTELESHTILIHVFFTLKFNPSKNPKDWPGIREPIPSITYTTLNIYREPEAAALESDLSRAFLKAFRTLVHPGAYLYAMEWPMKFYRVSPHEMPDDDDEWPISVSPRNPLCYFFLSRDFSVGLFRDSWEGTICVFGTPLIAALKDHPPRILQPPIRVNSIAV